MISVLCEWSVDIFMLFQGLESDLADLKEQLAAQTALAAVAATVSEIQTFFFYPNFEACVGLFTSITLLV